MSLPPDLPGDAAPVLDLASTPVEHIGGAIVARAAKYYRMTRYIMVVVLIGAGGWFCYDGFVNWPAQNERFIADPANKYKPGDKIPHQPRDVWLNKAIGLSCPPLAILLLAWALYNSRGEITLDGNTLYVPGHPPVPLDAIRELNDRQWDKKGIAYVSYATPAKSGVIKLDDFVYDRPPIDAIHDRIVAHLSPPAAGDDGALSYETPKDQPLRNPAL